VPWSPHRSDGGPPRRTGDVGLGDAVHAVRALGATSVADIAAIIEALDLEVGPVPLDAPVPAEPAMEPLRADDGTSHVDDGIAGPEKGTDHPVEPDDASRFSARVAHVDEDEEPEWLSDAPHISFSGVLGPGPPPAPPLSPSQARAAMATFASTRRPGSQLDIDWLSARVTTLAPIVPPRFVLELRIAPVVELLADCGQGMEPFAADLRFLTAELVGVAGADRVERRAFLGTPLRGVDPDPFTNEAIPWTPPSPGTLVIVLSDLGAGGPPGDPDRAPTAEWRAFASVISEAQARLRVLTPFAEDRRGTGIPEVACWESVEEVMAVRDR
jgi:hypothetical protein